MKETIKLYQCRSCGGLSRASKVTGCPYCDYSEGPTVMRNTIGEEEPVERQKSWYKLIEVKGEIYK